MAHLAYETTAGEPCHFCEVIAGTVTSSPIPHRTVHSSPKILVTSVRQDLVLSDEKTDNFVFRISTTFSIGVHHFLRGIP